MFELSEARVPTAPRFAVEIERMAAASEVANIPTVTKECNAIDIAGVESAQRNSHVNLCMWVL